MARSSLSRGKGFAAATAVLGASLVACNAIIGLSDFEKVECTNLRCPDDAGIDVFVPTVDGGDAGSDAGTPEGTDPVVWASWRMPSWDGGPSPVPEYSADTTTVLENITGLVWTKDDQGQATYEAAKAKCAALPGGTWRLPKRIELVTLLDFGRASSTAPISPLFGVVQAQYWTSSEVKPINAADPRVWVVDFSAPDKGNKLVTPVPTTDKTLQLQVRCVKGRT